MKKLFLVMAALVLLPASVAAQEGADAEREAVRQAVLDYVEGIYTVDASRIERSVHPELAKRGFFVKRGETAYSSDVMTFQQLVDLAKTYNKNGRVPKDAPKEVVIFDVSDQTASAKLTAVWGIDYIHLAKYDGKWKFVNVLWQTPPKSKK
ncbi:MAG TPA: nuclear transport factor 2 family protein [Pyrinomonadaceae bacterium]|nr:nuclear transport factor 2 family protein [Pyrinomonadaceae bacterium]